MNSQAFSLAYKALNPEQKHAVDTIEGPVMVVAGPGTGKTQILTLRIANILLQTDTSPESILALTFTESGARAMQERLLSYIGNDAYRVRIHTFHEFAGILMREYPTAYDFSFGNPLSDLDRALIIESLLTSLPVKHLAMRGHYEYAVKPIRDAISLMKREYISPDKLSVIIKNHEDGLGAIPQFHEKGAHKGKERSEYTEKVKLIEKNKELLLVYRAYTSLLHEQGNYDFDDMVNGTVEALKKDEPMLRSLQETYQYVLADEHQDVNGSQNALIELIVGYHERPNIFVVGDEKQSIYRFQGASLENFLYFEERFPHATIIALTQNYRSTQPILDCAHAFITEEKSPADELRVALFSQKEGGTKPTFTQYTHEAIEMDAIVHDIQEHIRNGVPGDEIAILFRTNEEVQDMSHALKKAQIPVTASAHGDVLSHPVFIHLEAILACIAEPQNEEALATVLVSAYTGITPDDIIRILASRSSHVPLWSLISDSSALRERGVSNPESVIRIAMAIQNARAEMLVLAPQYVLENILVKIGFIDHITKHAFQEGLAIVRRVYDEIELLITSSRTLSFHDIQRQFERYRIHGIALTSGPILENPHAVQVMTAHKAKGLEFSYVYIPHLTDNRWGGTIRRDMFKIPVAQHLKITPFDTNDDERKLLYVGMTRAKTHLMMSASDTKSDGGALLISRLMTTLRESSYVEEKQYTEENQLPQFGYVETRVPFDTTVLIRLLQERGLSVTALNNYLEDPWLYFFRNVLHFPEAKNIDALFGTATHDVLRAVLNERRLEMKPIRDSFIHAQVTHALTHLPLSIHQYTTLHERALQALIPYVRTHIDTLSYTTKEEYGVRAILERGKENLLLTGNLDRLDFSDTGALVQIIDYKTGKPKTRGEIEGATKSSNGNYKRQLIFYVLLLMCNKQEHLMTHQTVLSFIEPDSKGKIHEEVYMITDDEVVALEETIFRVKSEIERGSFLSSPVMKDNPYAHLIPYFMV